MNSRASFGDHRKRTDLRFISFLSKADGALRELHARAASICETGNLEILGFRREQLDTLCDVLSRGYQVLDRRIAELDGHRIRNELRRSADGFTQNAILEPIGFFACYRSCCRSLCTAMKEAMRLGNSPAVLMLRALILQLEKQLWMFDAPARNHGMDDSRAVALFLSC
jgi:hypothetical protein